MIIKSILDTDLYKFTTSYAYMKLFPQARGTFEFIDRDNTEYPEDFIERLYLELGSLGMLHLTKDEQEYMNNSCRFIPPVYWEWLSSFKFNSGKIQASLDENGHLHIKVTDYLYKVTLYEVPILAIVSELRSRIFDNNCDLADVIKRLSPKIKLSNVAGIKFSEFGTRRRFSYNVQDIVVSAIKEGSIYCTGTSNCHLAMKYDMPMMGTHPHEWFMFHGAMCRMTFSPLAPEVYVNAVEKSMYVPSYSKGIPTYDVLMELKSQMPNNELVIITTPETYSEIPLWHNGSTILKDYKFIMVINGEEPPYGLPDNVSLVYVPTIRMCSTCIRNRVKDGVGIKPFVRDDVYEIIKQHKLYV